MANDENIPIETDREEETNPVCGGDGVDPTLIRWMLSLSPSERLKVLQDTISSIERLRNAMFRNRDNRNSGFEKDRARMAVLKRTLTEKRKLDRSNG